MGTVIELSVGCPGASFIGVFFNDGIDVDGDGILEFSTLTEVQFTPIDIDIKPASDPNCFNSDGHGVIPVAILGSATLDVNDIDVPTLELDGQVVAIKGQNKVMCHLEDSNGDGFTDLVCKFEDDDGTYVQGDGTGTVTGNLLSGVPIEGSDSICITQ